MYIMLVVSNLINWMRMCAGDMLLKSHTHKSKSRMGWLFEICLIILAQATNPCF